MATKCHYGKVASGTQQVPSFLSTAHASSLPPTILQIHSLPLPQLILTCQNHRIFPIRAPRPNSAPVQIEPRDYKKKKARKKRSPVLQSFVYEN